MATILQIHPIQVSILRCLLFTPTCTFSELNVDQISTDQFSFHLRTLGEQDILEKLPNGKYTLTILGKEFANRFDTDRNIIERQAKIGVMMSAVKEENGQRYYLLQERLKQPFFGYIGFFGGKIGWGETIFEAGKREFFEEVGMQGVLTLKGVKHKMDYDAEGNLLEDKYFYICCVSELEGDFVPEFEGGRNLWIREDELDVYEQEGRFFDGVRESIGWLYATDLQFSETKYVVKGY